MYLVFIKCRTDSFSIILHLDQIKRLLDHEEAYSQLALKQYFNCLKQKLKVEYHIFYGNILKNKLDY